MHGRHRTIPASTRTAMACAAGAVCALAAAAPLLASHSLDGSASILYLLFSPFCHQIPERCFALWGCPLAVCHRCSGIYAGLLLGTLLARSWALAGPRMRRCTALCAVLPMLFDFFAPYAGLWTSTASTRFSTGLLFGILVTTLIARGLSELAQEAPWRQLTMHFSQIKGGIS